METVRIHIKRVEFEIDIEVRIGEHRIHKKRILTLAAMEMKSR